jgi:hypothetical protein
MKTANPASAVDGGMTLQSNSGCPCTAATDSHRWVRARRNS